MKVHKMTVEAATLADFCKHLEASFFRTLGMVGGIQSELDYGERLAIGRDGSLWAWTIEIFRTPIQTGYELRKRTGNNEQPLGVIRVDERLTGGVEVVYQELVEGAFAAGLTEWLRRSVSAKSISTKKRAPQKKRGPREENQVKATATHYGRTKRGLTQLAAAGLMNTTDRTYRDYLEAEWLLSDDEFRRITGLTVGEYWEKMGGS